MDGKAGSSALEATALFRRSTPRRLAGMHAVILRSPLEGLVIPHGAVLLHHFDLTDGDDSKPGRAVGPQWCSFSRILSPACEALQVEQGVHFFCWMHGILVSGHATQFYDEGHRLG